MTNKQFKYLFLIHNKPKTIRYMCRHMRMNVDTINEFVIDSFLNDCFEIQRHEPNENSLIKINTMGLEAFEVRLREQIRFWLPYATSLLFSIAALIMSIIALARQ